MYDLSLEKYTALKQNPVKFRDAMLNAGIQTLWKRYNYPYFF